MYAELFLRLKDQFREFCGSLSIEEIMNNKPLIEAIETFHRSLNTINVGGN